MQQLNRQQKHLSQALPTIQEKTRIMVVKKKNRRQENLSQFWASAANNSCPVSLSMCRTSF